MIENFSKRHWQIVDEEGLNEKEYELREQVAHNLRNLKVMGIEDKMAKRTELRTIRK